MTREIPAAPSAAVAQLIHDARAAWAAASITLPDAVFAQACEARLARTAHDQRLHAGDLFLACACMHGDPQAIAAFEQRYLASIRRALGRARVPDAIADDVAGSLSARLFVAIDGARPLVEGYSGRGELGAWARSVALHTALKIMRRERRHVPFDRSVEVPLVDPELVYLRELYAAQLRPVLADAFAALDRAERAILRQYYRHGLTIDELGRLHGVHRVTAARRVKHAREALVREVKQRIARHLDAADPSVDSILQLVGSRLSVERLLRTTQVIA